MSLYLSVLVKLACKKNVPFMLSTVGFILNLVKYNCPDLRPSEVY
jgi:hypothetical protein